MPRSDPQRFDPPAPVASVVIRNPDLSALQSNVAMLIDSGADVTLVPMQALESLSLQPVAETRYELMGFDGTTSFAQVVRLELLFEGRTFRGQFLITQDDVGVLGRNVLNTIPLALNGPHQEWYELRET